jgi:wyosine [tRNA(Phe)-imidazoG37] synthetase (radical SAM superfamily)
MLILNKIAEFEKSFGHSDNHNKIDNRYQQRESASLKQFDKTLEINCVPYKVCPGDCIYCPHKATIRKTVERESFFPIDRVLNEIVSKLYSDTSIERILVTGCGDPALNSDIAALLHRLKDCTTVPVTVKSCGALLWRESVCNDLMNADVVHVNVDAADKYIYRNVNRYHLLIPFVRYLDGVHNFRQRFNGEFAVNVHLLHGFNTQVMHLDGLLSLIRELEPDKVFVHTTPGLIVNSQETEVDSGCLRDFVSWCGPVASIDSAEKMSW